MIMSALRPVIRLTLLAGILTTTVLSVSETAIAQVTCYRTRCVVYPDGMRICERTPVDCATLQL
jgi:hypothetical protein